MRQQSSTYCVQVLLTANRQVLVKKLSTAESSTYYDQVLELFHEKVVPNAAFNLPSKRYSHLISVHEYELQRILHSPLFSFFRFMNWLRY